MSQIQLPYNSPYLAYGAKIQAHRGHFGADLEVGKIVGFDSNYLNQGFGICIEFPNVEGLPSPSPRGDDYTWIRPEQIGKDGVMLVLRRLEIHDPAEEALGGISPVALNDLDLVSAAEIALRGISLGVDMGFLDSNGVYHDRVILAGLAIDAERIP